MGPYRSRLLRGASSFAMVTALGVSAASAQTVAGLLGAAHISVQPGGNGGGSNPTIPSYYTPAMKSAAVRALQNASRVQQAVDLTTQAQQAARAAAQALSSNVPDGLGVGGLNPVVNGVLAAQDPTGLVTWDGASAPVQTKNGSEVDVTINQTQARAILDWQTFNVGKNTTLIFNQKQNGQAQKSWVALNRVVGQLDPHTGLRNPNDTPAPSQILGSIKSDGTVLILNQNGVIFNGTSQIDTNSLIVTSLEIGRAFDGSTPLSIGQRNTEFLQYGLLGYADQASQSTKASAFTFSAQGVDTLGDYDPLLEGTIQIDAGASINSGDGGFLLFTGPKIINSGSLYSNEGEVVLQSGREVTLQRSSGAANSIDPNVRGFIASSLDRTDAAGGYVENTAGAIISAPLGYLALGANDSGAVIDAGTLFSTTSVSRNGFIDITGGDIKIAPDATLMITPDGSGQTIPQDPISLKNFKPSKIDIGSASSRIEIGSDAMIYAPSGNVTIGADPGSGEFDDSGDGGSRIFIDTGAMIDVAGLIDIMIPAYRNSIQISPVKGNELRDTPNYRDSFLNGATVFVDPRLSGVRADGVTWIGSPLIDAASYYQQVGVSVGELMTRGGNVTLGVAAAGTGDATPPDVTVKSGATIDISGGWVTYQAGMVQTTKLVDASGHIVDISNADPNDRFIGIYDGFNEIEPRWGVDENWASPLLFGAHYVGAYSEGRDAGSLTLKSSAAVFDGTLIANSYPGARQTQDANAGTGTSDVYGDERLMQAAPSQLPSGGFLFVQALGTDLNGNLTGGGDIEVQGAGEYQPVSGQLQYGQSVYIDANGNLVTPVRDPNSYLPIDRVDTIMLSSATLSNSGLAQVSLQTSGKITVTKDADVELAPGGAFDALAGRGITIDGKVTVASGAIQLETVDMGFGSVFIPTDPQLGSFDININGTLSTRGLWTNDYGAGPSDLKGGAFTNGGTISLIVAPRVSLFSGVAGTGDGSDENVDLSGSILLNKGSLLDVSGGGYVRPDGSFDLSARGGNLNLISETTYFQLTDDSNRLAGGLPGFRVNGIFDGSGNQVIPVNPDDINARVSIADGTILAAGFGGGGTFTLETPQFQFGSDTSVTGTELGLDFFSKSGFANYNIVSYKTALIQNEFDNGYGGTNALLDTQILTIGAGQTLDLTQTYFSNNLDGSQIQALHDLQSGGDLYSVLTPSAPADPWDRRAINLTLGGLMELHVAKGGSIVGDAGTTLTVSQLFNEGTIRLPGGTIRQAEILPALYASSGAIGVHDLSEVFSINPDGTIPENGLNTAGIKDGDGNLLTNAQVAATHPIYLLGDLKQGEGMRLAPGSVTDLSGEAIINPRAQAVGQGMFHQVTDGIVVGGGMLETAPSLQMTTPLFRTTIGQSVYSTENPVGVQLADTMIAEAGSNIDLSGASATFTRPTANGQYSPTLEWSDGGTLYLGNGGTITGANIDAHGGAPNALGGTLVALDPVLYQNDPTEPTDNTAISASMMEGAGFDTFVAQGSISSEGDVLLKLGRGFFLTSRPYAGTAGQDLNDTVTRDGFAPVISSGGVMEIDAPYIHFDSNFQTISSPLYGDKGDNTAIFRADDIDISGAVLADQSISHLILDAKYDLRLTGVEPWQLTYNFSSEAIPSSLGGQLAVNGDLDIIAGQVYPTTGSTFYLTSSADDGTIKFSKSDAPTPSTPYSAGGNLLIQAANIIQGGVIRAPIGSLTLGANDPFTITTDGIANTFAPATESVHVLDGSITSVSAEGLVIPYGTTTDQIEWFFAPTGSDKLTAPPAAVLDFGGNGVTIDSGASVDLRGGGDLYAYEFISGIGGSRDVLDRFNADEFSSANGYQYPDGRQVYAIVPGLSNVNVAAYDPIYSADYSDLYSASAAGKSVYLAGGQGVAAGWYTLLPAQYAMLPGGMRVVEQTGSPVAGLGRNAVLADGTVVTTGYYGTSGTGTYDSNVVTFDLQSQSVFTKYSDIALTYANEKFSAIAAKNGHVPPRLPVDAGRLVLNPAALLVVNAAIETTPGAGGRGAEADISGAAFDIVSVLPPQMPDDGTIVFTADSLSNLGAASLLIGGTRTENADGTTSLDITAHSILVENDAAHPLTGPETILAVDGSGAGITLADGATIIAKGTNAGEGGADYIIDGSVDGMTGQGALLRVANGPERLVTRENQNGKAKTGQLDIGNATLQGDAVLLESSGDMKVSSDANIAADDLALGAGQVTFTNDTSVTDGLVITSQLQALFAKAGKLTIRTPNAIAFSSGTYDFGNLHLDTPGLELLDGNSVTINAGVLQLSNVKSGQDGCGADGAPVCGDGNLAINAAEIDFGWGTEQLYGFGNSVTLASTGGIFELGQGEFDAGPAALFIETPFIGDKAVNLALGQDAIIPSLTLTSTGAVTISNPGDLTIDTPAGIPGSSLSINGDTVTVTGSTLRATAGKLDIEATNGIDIGAGAVLETPGYSKTFGDSADPVTVSAPGGTLKLTSVDGDIDLEKDSLLSVGGGTGQAGTLDISASKGTVDFAGAVDSSAPEGGGSLILDSGSGFDLDTFAAGAGSDFDGSIDIRTADGNLTLSSGHELKADNIELTADGGLVDIGGTIDVSGDSGGAVQLYGINGVTLEGSARIDAHADGYGEMDTRRASGGSVEIGTDGTGIITVDSGALIDVSARKTGDKLVPMLRNGTIYYTYVPGDEGGVVNFRAPVIGPDGAETVNVFYSGTINGAREIDLEGFKRFDLADIADDPNFVGVTIDDKGEAVLDLGATGSDGQFNFLADYGDGTLVQFVQDFDISSANSHLGSLVSSPVFHERPGMELDYSGNIVLQSNWNLGAGVVDVAGAVAAGLMAPVPSLPGQFYVLPGKEAEVFQDFTTLTYRTDHGSVTGEPGILSLRAGGTLDLKGSITDGFFQFGDQTDPGYLNLALGGGDKLYSPYLFPGCETGSCGDIGDWGLGDLPSDYVSISLASTLAAYLENPAPYSAAANSPAALGSLPGNTGDPLGSAVLFPLLVNADGSTSHVDSWSYRLVGGADLTGGHGGMPSVDPMRVMPGSTASVIVEGEQSYTYAAIAGTSAFDDSLLLRVGSEFVTPDQWFQAFMAENPQLSADSYTFFNFASAPKDVQSILSGEATAFFANYAGQYQFVTSKSGVTGVTTTLALAAKFMSEVVAPNFGAIAGDYKPPNPKPFTKDTTATTRTVIRTGDGNIQVAAAGDIDLRNGATATKRDLDGKDDQKHGFQVGGTAIYTAGYRANLAPKTIVDSITGLTEIVDPTGYTIDSDIFGTPLLPPYQYGAGELGGQNVGYAGILIANPVYAEGGGNVSLNAGRDVLGRRDVFEEVLLSTYDSSAYSWIGNSDQPWRTGGIGNVNNALINPQLFHEGVGALAGGNITVKAGRDISDLSVVDTTSITTANVGRPNGKTTRALWTLNGGNVNVSAGRDILGGRFDVASGSAFISAGNDILSDGTVPIAIGDGPEEENGVRLRLSDATVQIEAGGSVDIQGIEALGIQQNATQVDNNLNSRGFYSDEAGVSILANAGVTIDNQGQDVVTPNQAPTKFMYTAVYPGSLSAISFTGDLDLTTGPAANFNQANKIILYPSSMGTLQLLAGGNIAPTTIAMSDADPGLLPGIFSIFHATQQDGVLNGEGFVFPGIVPNTTQTARERMHNKTPTHTGDTEPNRIYAGGDILDMTLSVPKQTRIGAGRDIVNMMFFGQNLTPDDITRIVAGRDITATTVLVRPLIAPLTFGDPLPSLQGNTFVISGPGSFFLEAGRDAGPFLNSAVTNGFYYDVQGDQQGDHQLRAGEQIFAGGVISVGNEWNPWLPSTGADLYVEFGVGKGASYDAFRNYYLDPANLPNLDGGLFVQVTDANGNMIADRSKPIYGPVLIQWMQSHAADKLIASYGTTDVSFEQAYDVFKVLPELDQRVFILDKVYFNELIAASIPTGPSYQQYSRGYLAVNTLFPASLGYTANDLSGGSNGANETVETGDLDLRLAAIETTRGGNIYLLGPGGRVLAGSTVRTSEQAARRIYDGGRLFEGIQDPNNFQDELYPATIESIPAGYEGILTLRGGSIDAFTDQDFLLNQSRLFTENGGDIIMWSSNGDLNAGQGPKTSANFPPIVVLTDEDLYSQVDSAGGVTGAGIAAFEPAPDVPAPDVFLVAPRGTVDAGDAGVRVAGNLFIAALTVANANNFTVGGSSSGIPQSKGVDVSVQTSASASAAAAAQAAQSVATAHNNQDQESVITVEVVGFASGGESEEQRKKKKK